MSNSFFQLCLISTPGFRVQRFFCHPRFSQEPLLCCDPSQQELAILFSPRTQSLLVVFDSFSLGYDAMIYLANTTKSLPLRLVRFDSDILHFDAFDKAKRRMSRFVNCDPVDMGERANPLSHVQPVLSFGEMRLGYGIYRTLCHGMDVVLALQRVIIDDENMRPGPLVSSDLMR